MNKKTFCKIILLVGLIITSIILMTLVSFATEPWPGASGFVGITGAYTRTATRYRFDFDEANRRNRADSNGNAKTLGKVDQPYWYYERVFEQGFATEGDTIVGSDAADMPFTGAEPEGILTKSGDLYIQWANEPRFRNDASYIVFGAKTYYVHSKCTDPDKKYEGGYTLDLYPSASSSNANWWGETSAMGETVLVQDVANEDDMGTLGATMGAGDILVSEGVITDTLIISSAKIQYWHYGIKLTKAQVQPLLDDSGKMVLFMSHELQAKLRNTNTGLVKPIEGTANIKWTNRDSLVQAAIGKDSDKVKANYYNRRIEIKADPISLFYIQEDEDFQDENKWVRPMKSVILENDKAVENIDYTTATCGEWKGSAIKYIPKKIYYYEGDVEYTEANRNYITDSGGKITLEAGKEKRVYVCEYELKDQIKVIIRLMLDTEEHMEGSEYCIPYDSNPIQYNGNGYVKGEKTKEVKKGTVESFELLDSFMFNGTKYELINSYLKWQASESDCDWHVDASVNPRNPSAINSTLYIIAEYKAPSVKIIIHYMEDTDVHGAGAGTCVNYTDTGKKIQDDREMTGLINTTVVVDLDQAVAKEEASYELINSYYQEVGGGKQDHTGASATKNVRVGTKEIHVVQEYKKIPPPEKGEVNETPLRLQRLDPLASAQIMSDNRSSSSPASDNVSTQKYDVRLTGTGYMGIATHETLYAQVLTASRNLIDMEYVRVEGDADFDVTITKYYPYVWWEACYVVQGCGNSGQISASSPSGGGSVADGQADNRWRHDEINAKFGGGGGCAHNRNCGAHKTTYRSELSAGCYAGVNWNSSTGRVYGLGGSWPYGGDCCNWSYSGCTNNINHCNGHPDSEWVDTSYINSKGKLVSRGYTRYFTSYCSGCTHQHKDYCIRYDRCYGHQDKLCTQSTFYCSSGCAGHARRYLGKQEFQCEVSGCIHNGNYTVNRTYRYNRKYLYYYVKSYTGYKLETSNIYNTTLGEAGFTTVNNVDYTLGNRMYVPREEQFKSGWLEYILDPDTGAQGYKCNFHIKAPLKKQTETHKFSELNETPYQNANTGLTVSGQRPISNRNNWNSSADALKAAREQARIDLANDAVNMGTSSSTSTNKNYRNEDNDIWMIGENRSVLRVRNDYLWHDGYIMEMYGRIGNSERNVFSNSDGINDSTLKAPLPNNGYYATNRTDVIARATGPEEITGEYTTTKRANIRSESGSQYIYNSTCYYLTSAVSPGRVRPGLGWGGTGTDGRVLYKKNVEIPRTVPNNIYESQMTMHYVQTSPANVSFIRKWVGNNTSAAGSVDGESNEVNSVVVHTPVYITATLVQEAEGTQALFPIKSSSELEIDKEYTLRANLAGQHRNAKGYKTKDYGPWVREANGERMIQVSFPFDVYINSGNGYEFLPKGKWKNFRAGSTTIDFKVPVWTTEREYIYGNNATDDPGEAENILNNTIVVRVIAENDPDAFGGDTVIGRNRSNYSKTGSQNILYPNVSYDYRAYFSVNVNVVGKVYDFKFEYTDDDAYTETMQNGFSGLFANDLPFAQEWDNPGRPTYQYALRLGYKFKYTLKTKGTKSTDIKIVPSVYYVQKDGTGFKKVNVYYEIDGSKYELLKEGATFELDTNMTKSGELPYVSSDKILNTHTIIEQIYNDAYGEHETFNKPKQIAELRVPGTLSSAIDNEFNYNKTRKIGTLGKVLLNEYVRLRYDAANEYEAERIYGNRTDTQIKVDAGTADNFVKSISEWYGEYRLPSTTVFTDPKVDSGKLYNTNTGKMQNITKDGYLIVFFNIETLDNKGTRYLSYQLPTKNTQWDKEGYDYTITLPNGKMFTFATPKTTECAAICIYEALINKDGNVIGPN